MLVRCLGPQIVLLTLRLGWLRLDAGFRRLLNFGAKTAGLARSHVTVPRHLRGADPLLAGEKRGNGSRAGVSIQQRGFVYSDTGDANQLEMEIA